MQRVIVVGTSGSGKSTMAQAIANRLGYPHTEIDSLYWEPNWQGADPETLKQRVAQTIAADCWVVDGNYSSVRDMIWRRADTLIWLDYPRWLVMSRIIRRTFKRMLTREQLWETGNRESLRNTFSKDSVIVWAWTTYNRRKREYPVLIAQPEYTHLTVYRLHSPREADQWLAKLRNNHD